MKKIMTVLLLVAATMSALAVDYTAGAMVTLSATSGQSCDLTIAEAAEFGALGGTEMNMDGRKVALYGLNGATPLQVVTGADLTNLKLGLLTDASTDYTITVTAVKGSETLKLRDLETGLEHELSLGAIINFTATANVTNNARFIINYSVSDFEICFRDNELQITANPYAENVVVKDENGAVKKDVAPDPLYQAIDLSDLAAGRYTVELNGGARKFIIVKQ